ncbi:MAG: RiPP maturation radical SAM C-methyltransferase [Acidobacteriota bacterium]
MDCCLVNMPFMEVRRPSLAIGLLQAALEADGLTAQSVYGNLLFCEHAGLPAIQVMFTGMRSLLCDWVFARAAFPEFDPDPEPFFEDFVKRGTNLGYRAGQAVREGVLKRFLQVAIQLRAQVDGYLDKLIDRVLAGNPRAVGCSSTFEQHVASLALLRRIHAAAPDVVTMLGGANCESVMGVATHRNFPWVDFVVSGEADRVIGPLVRSVLRHGRDIPATELAAGVFGPAHRPLSYPSGEDGRPPRAVVSDVTSLPAPNYDDYFSTLKELRGLKLVIRPTLMFQTSRGCWWHAKGGCTFCGLNGQNDTYRSRNAQQVIQQIRQMAQRYGVRTFMMVDNIVDMRYIESLLPLLKADEVTRDCRFFYETKSNLEPHHVRSLREAGVTWIQPGIESLNTELLRLMNKGCQAWQNIQLLKSCLRYGVRPVWHLLHGFPQEQDAWYQEMAELMPLLHHLPRPTLFTYVQLQRFSAYHSHQERFGLKLVPLRDYRHTYPLEPEEIEQLAFFFNDEREAELALDPMYAFLDGQGLDAARSAFHEWKDCWKYVEQRPILRATEMDGCLLIRDTRKIAVAESHELVGIRKDVYAAADSGPLLRSLITRFANQGIAPGTVEGAVRELVELKLALPVDRRLLALAVPEPAWPFPTNREYLGGAIELERFEAATK